MIDPKELVWVARYNDGSYHTQYNVDGSYRDRYADIVRKNLLAFELWKSDMKTLILRVHFDTPEKKLIYRRRVFMHSDGRSEKVYLAGWQVRVGKQNVQSISLVFEDDLHIEHIGKWRLPGDKHFQLMEEPVHHPHEGEDWKPERPPDSFHP